MPSKAPSTAAARALQAAATPARMAAATLGQAGSGDALSRLDAAMQEIKALAVRPMLHRAMDALRAERFAAGAEWAIKALDRDERSGFGWYLLAIALERLGDFANSVNAYQSALALLPDHAEVANDLGRLAYRMGMRPQAEQLFRHFLARRPDHPEACNNLACAIREQGRLDEAVEVLRPAIIKRPDIAMLWNTMGTVVADGGDFPSAETFYREALRLDEGFAKARYNLGNARLALGDAEGALEACTAALAGTTVETERQMILLARSTINLVLGRLGEGWDDYEARLHPQFSEVTHFLIDRPRWTPGDALAGRSLLVVGEQGLGDEVLFANLLPDVQAALGPEGRLSVAVEARLAPLFRRSFPQACVGAHATYELNTRPARNAPFIGNMADIDLWAPMASLLREHRRDIADFPLRQSYLAADPARVAHWRKVLAEAPPGPKVGLLWKSAFQAAGRHRYFSPFGQWAPVLRQPGVSFVSLQYGDCAEDLAYARETLGVDIWTPPGIDLKQDLDEVAALGCALDLVLGFSNASFNLAAACGAPAWLITTPGAWTTLGAGRYPWYPQVRTFTAPAFGDWSAVMEEVAAALAKFAAGD